MKTWDLFLTELEAGGYRDWPPHLMALCQQRLSEGGHGHMQRWWEAIDHLPPNHPSIAIDGSGAAVRVVDDRGVNDHAALRDPLMLLHPWRKGPFELFGLTIDTEWQSHMKWDRMSPAVDFRGKRVLDIGCGNGYYGWRMLAAGAQCVVGYDPYLLYNLQFQVINRYASEQCRHFVLPLTDQELPESLRLFDIVVSMGVLYHRSSPIEHLQALGGALRDGGELVLETLVLDAVDEHVLVPANRYAKMRNVWFIPSVAMLIRWLERTGFGRIEVVDVTATSCDEQRRTEWMTFESLTDFLSPHDPALTIEGYPAPRRAILLARH